MRSTPAEWHKMDPILQIERANDIFQNHPKLRTSLFVKDFEVKMKNVQVFVPVPPPFGSITPESAAVRARSTADGASSSKHKSAKKLLNHCLVGCRTLGLTFKQSSRGD